MRTVCIVTGSRADYGLLSPLIAAVEETPGLAQRLVATGAHLSPAHGFTVAEVEAEGWKPERVDMLLASDSPLAIAKSLGLAVIGMAEAFDRIRPDVVVVLGDRYEILAAAEAALLLRIPLAHIHGGERTEGALDEGIRHAITKMASLHFTATAAYARRVVQMGERPETVFDVGALAADNVRRLVPVGRDDLESALGIPLAEPVLLVTYHPTTADPAQDEKAMEALLAAFDNRPEATLVFTGVNADAGRAILAARIQAYAEARGNAAAVNSLGWRRYLSLMRLAAALVGNSSSGMIEAPIMGVPTVNIGARQGGRLRPPGVLDCGTDAPAITAALDRALDPALRASLAEAPSPFGDGRTARRICEVLAAFPLASLVVKPFHDL